MTDFSGKLQPAEPSGPTILSQERGGSDVNIDQLSKHLLSRDGWLDRQKKILPLLESHPYFCKRNQLNMARPDRYHLGLARAKQLRRWSIKHGWSKEDYHIADYLMDEMGPYALQATMFATSIREQCSEEQKAYWLPKVENWEIIGCYAQTELGHGSNVRGIECQAVWKPETKEFIIHSPTLTASKWWNGSMGRTANHAIVVAQLMLPDKAGTLKSHGPHQFIVQIRDMKTHKPMKGVVVGDIGPKYGYPAMDNGYLLFNNYKVPHAALLSKYSGVDASYGTYIKPDNPALVYGSLTFVRAQIIMHARLVLARALTIAVRYLSIRHQFSDRDAKGNAPEKAVLNYPTVQIRILPLLATTYALHYTGEAMYKLYWGTRQDIESKGDMSRLAQMHADSSGLKSLCTTLAADGIETCRRAMGGHGFGGGSGMIALNNEYLSKPTVEGDNWMITQQTASYLIKQMTTATKSDTKSAKEPILQQFITFLNNKDTTPSFDVPRNESDLVQAFAHRASFLAYQVYQARVIQKQSWTSMMISLHKLSRAHCESLLVSNFYNAVYVSAPSPALDPATHAVMKHLFKLFTLFTLDSSASEFLVSGALSVAQLRHIMPEIQSLMTSIRPHAVRLVDAWCIPDYLLESALGKYDGDVYNELFKKAHTENPLNRVTFNPDWKTEEIVMGEGEDVARKRIERIALGHLGGKGQGSEYKAKL